MPGHADPLCAHAVNLLTLLGDQAEKGPRWTLTRGLVEPRIWFNLSWLTSPEQTDLETRRHTHTHWKCVLHSIHLPRLFSKCHLELHTYILTLTYTLRLTNMEVDGPPCW